MAMEFARTASAYTAKADDSWLRRGTRSFFLYCAGAGLETLCVFC